MNTYYKAPSIVHKWQAVVLTASLVVFSFLPAISFFETAQAAPTPDTYSISATSVVIVGTEATLSGVAFTDANGANSNANVTIAIDWNEDGLGDGDGNPFNVDAAEELSDSITDDTNCSNGDCNIEWGPISHDYTSAGAGTYTAYAFICHGQCVGQDGLLASQIAEISIVILPQCSNGEDDDGDTLIDEDDPACYTDDVYDPDLDDESNDPATTGTLTLVKVLPNDNGGTATESNFSVYIDDVLSSWSSHVLEAGPYTVTEDSIFGYEQDLSACGDSGVVTVSVGEETTCTITNDDIPPFLELIKEVVGDALASLWTLSADGLTPISGTTPVTSGSDFMADTYALTESVGPDDYVASGWVCTGDGVQEGADITLDVGESATCTITNTFTPPIPGSITIVKNTIGGDDIFSFTGDLGSFDLTTTGGTDSEIFTDLTPGTYSVSETGSLGWEQTDAFCDNEDNPSEITLEEDESVTCTFENTRQVGTLIVVKELINDDEGELSEDDFSFQINDGEPIVFEEDGDNELTVSVGSYVVTEVEQDGYTTTYSNCEVEVGPDETVTCTITNNDVASTPDPDPEPEPEVSSGGGGGGGGGGFAVCSNSRDDDGDGLVDTLDPSCHSDGNASNPSSYVPSGNSEGSSGQVLGAFTTGEVLGDSCGLYMDKFVRSGYENDVDQVMKLQTFLNKWMDANLPVTGVYGPLTLSFTNAFQVKYADQILAPWGINEPTGIVYQTTLRWVNMLECPALSLVVPSLIDWSRNPNAPHLPLAVTTTPAQTNSASDVMTAPDTNDESMSGPDSEDQTATVLDAEEATGGFWNFLKGIFGR